MAKLGTAWVDVQADFSGLDRETDKHLTSSKSKFASFGKSIGGALAAAGVVKFATDSINAASDVNESLTKNQTLFGKYAKGVEKFSDTSAKSFGISKKAALEYTGVFGNLFRSMGQSEEASAKQSTALTKLAADMASFNNTSIEDALEAIRSGLVGETEPLRRFGVNMNDATLRAQALKMGLIDSVKEALDPQTKALAASALITKQTAQAHGDFAKTSNGLANQQRILGARFSDLSVELGQKLLPIGLKIVSFFVDLIDKLPSIVSSIRNVVTAVVDFTRGMIDFIAQSAPFKVFAALVENSVNTIIKVVEAAIKVFKGIIDFVAGIFSGDWGRAWKGIQEIFSGVWDAMIAVITGAWERVKIIAEAGLKAMIAALKALGGLLLDLGNWIIDQIVGGLKAVANLLVGAATWIKDQIVTAIQRNISFFTNIGNWVLNRITDGFEAVAGLVTGAATWFKDTMVRGITNIATFFKNLGNQILGYISTGFQVAGSVFSDIATWVKDRLTNAINAIAAIFKSIGQTILGFLATGLKVAGSVFSDIAEWVKDRLTNAIAAIGGLFRNIGNAVLGYLATGFKVAGDLFKDIADWFYDRLSNAASFIATKFKGIGGSIVGWIVDGLRGAGKLVQGFFNDVIHVVNVPLKFLGLGTIGDIRIFGAARGDIIGGDKLIEGFSTGGEVRRGTRLTKPMIMMGEEAPKHPEYVIPTNPAYRDRALKLYEALGQEIHADAGGGILDTLAGGITRLPSTIGGLFGGKNPVQEALDKMPAIPAMPTWMHGIAREIKEKVVAWLKDKVAGLFSAGDPATGAGFTGGRLQLPSAFNPTHQTAGLPGYPAIDVFAAPGSAVLSPITGTVTRRSGRDPKFGAYEGAGGPFGWSLYLSDGVHSYFLTHFGSIGVAVGEKIKAGQYLGTVGDYPGSVPDHIHEGRTGYAQGGIIQGPFVGSFANGGMVQATGLAQVHAGEVITPAGHAPSEVRVFIGERELTDIVRVEVDGQRRGSAAQFRAGSHR